MVTLYFQCQPWDFVFKDSLKSVVCVCVFLCVCFSCLTTKSSQSSSHCLVWCSQQLKHIPWLHTFLPFGFVCLHDFPLSPVSQRPPRDTVHAYICQRDTLLQCDVCLRDGTEGGLQLQGRMTGGRAGGKIRCFSTAQLPPMADLFSAVAPLSMQVPRVSLKTVLVFPVVTH